MPTCLGCGIERKDISTPCSVCGAAPSAAPPQPTIPVNAKACPFCSELIQATAKKCKHCGEFLDGQVRPPAGATAIKPAPKGMLNCQQCGGAMKKATVTSGQAAGCAMALICFFVGCGLLMVVPIGTVIGILLIICSLFMGGRRQKVWKCTKCGTTVNRA